MNIFSWLLLHLEKAVVQNIFEKFVEHAGPPKRAWQNHAHFYVLQKTDEYFSMITFASSKRWSKIFLRILSSMPDHPKGRGRATPIFYLENYYKKTSEYFSMTFLTSSRLWSKIFLEILSRMVDHLKGRGRTTPIFR